MKVVLSESKFLKEPLFIISELVNEIILKFSKEKLSMLAMDPSSVALLSFDLLNSSFVDYNVEEDLELGVNLDNIKQVLRRVKPSDTLVLELEDNRLKISLKSDNTRTFNIPLINIEDQTQETRPLKFDAKVEMSSSLFEEAVSDIEVVSDAMDLKLEDNKLILESTDNLNHAKVEFNKSEDVSFESSGEPIRSRYSIDYLKKITKAGRLTDKITLHFSNDYPLKVEYKVVDRLSISMILAPRVINED